MTSQELYFDKCTDPEQWLLLAKALKETAKPLEDKLGVLMGVVSDGNYLRDHELLYKEIDVLYMLWAFSIENLAKSIIVKGNASIWKDKSRMEKLPEVLNEHNLGRLLESAGLDYLSRQYGGLLSKLTESIYWRGRYPVPKNLSDYETDAAYASSLLSSSHLSQMNQIYCHLLEKIKAISGN